MKKTLFYVCLLAVCALIFTSCGTSADNLSGEDLISFPDVSVNFPEKTQAADPETPKKTPTLEEKYDFWLPLEYDYIYEFSDGYAWLEQDETVILMGEDNNFISSTPEYKVVSLYEDTVCFQDNKTLKYGLMKKNGAIIIAPQYDWPFHFSEGLSYVSENDKTGYMNTKGELVIDYLYDFGCPFKEGLASVGINGYEDADGRWAGEFCFINVQGDVISGPFEYLGSEVFTFNPAYMEYSDGYTAWFDFEPRSDDEYGRWGYMDKNGDIAIPAKYLSTRPFYEGLAAVQRKDSLWVYIDKNGNEVMEGAPGDFANGMACVGDKFIDKSGKVLFEMPDGYTVEGSRARGLGKFSYGMYIVYNKDNRDAVINTKGEIILEAKEFQEIRIFKENLVAVKINDKWGVIRVSK